MIEVELVIVIVAALVVWLFIHLRKKKHGSVDTKATEQAITSAPELEPEPIIEQSKPASVKQIQEPVNAITETPTEEVNDALVEAQEEIIVKSETTGLESSQNIPEDATLKRHYLQNLASLADVPEAPGEEINTVIVETEEKIITKPETAVLESSLKIPEDSALKRHFMQQLVAEIEATMPARPTDSTLKRHYDAHLMSLVASRLQALQ